MGRKILFITTDQQRYDSLRCNGGTIARTPEVARDARCIRRERDAVHPDSVRTHVLTGEHGAARRHAHHVLRMRAVIDDSPCREGVDHGRARDGTTVASQRVVALLIGGDEENLATH